MGRKKTGKTPSQHVRASNEIMALMKADQAEKETWDEYFRRIYEASRPKNKCGTEIINVAQKSEIKEFGNPAINRCIAHLEKEIEGTLDGTKAKNRQFCHLLINKMKKDYPDKDPEAQILALITFGRKDSFHGKNMTSFEYIYKNKQKIIEAVRSQKQQSRNLVINDPSV